MAGQLAAALLLPAFCAALGEPQLEVKVNRNQVYLGESVVLEVQVSGADRPEEPDLSAIRNCKIKSFGSRDSSFRSFVFDNGRIRQEGYTRRTFTYEIAPTEPGDLVIGPITVKADGRTLEAAGPSLHVTGIEKQEVVEIKLSASRDAVLVDEPFEVRLTVLLRRLTGKFADTDPLFPNAAPVLNVPFLDRGEIDGLKGPDIGQLLQSKLVRTRNQSGFAINNYTIENDPFDFSRFFDMRNPFQQQPARFQLDKRFADRDGVPYVEYAISVTYHPLVEGTYTFGPVIFKGNVPIEVNDAGEAMGREIFAVGPAVTVRVIPPPEQDRPDSYIGAIGSNLLAEAALDTQTCNVGDPVTMTLTISGDIQMRNIAPLRLSLQTNVLAHFDVYDDSVKTVKKDGQRQYVYILRPRHAGTFELPPISVSFYDVNARAYRTAQTRSIPFKAREAAEVTASQIVSSPTNRPRDEHKRAEDELWAVAGQRLDSSGACPASLVGNPAALAALAGGGPLVFLGTLALQHLRRHRRRYEKLRRRRRAYRTASRAIARAARQARRDSAAAHRALCAAMRGYLADRFDAAVTAMTPLDAGRMLQDNRVAETARARFCRIMEFNFNAGYGAPATAERIEADCRAAAEVITDIEHEQAERPGSGKPRSPAKGAVAGVLACCLLGLPLGTAQGATQAERDFLWNEAHARMAAASRPQDFLGAAEAYQQLVDLNVRNSSVFYNLGTALLGAERYDDAITALSRAERYGGSSPDITRNLQIARAKKAKLKELSVSWDRVLLFWHYDLACATRVLITVCAFALLWVGLTLRRVGWRRTAKAVVVVALTALVIFGSSAATSLHQEAKARRPILTLDSAVQRGVT